MLRNFTSADFGFAKARCPMLLRRVLPPGFGRDPEGESCEP